MDKLWYAAIAKEAIKLGERLYELNKDPKTREDIEKLKQFIESL